MKITWQIDAASRVSQYTEIDNEELNECDEINREDFIRDHIQKEFLQTITWCEIYRS